MVDGLNHTPHVHSIIILLLLLVVCILSYIPPRSDVSTLFIRLAIKIKYSFGFGFFSSHNY